MRRNTPVIWSACIILIVFHCRSISQIRLEPFADGFTRPVAISHGGDSRLFVVEQEGRIVVVDSSGHRNPEPFLDIVQKVTSIGNEQGLLGLAFHPDYAQNGYFFVNYTDVDGNTAVSRFSVSDSDAARADTGSEIRILQIEQPFQNHNGGDLKFGPDGYLYISSGDGGSGGDPGNRAQDSTVLLGKILRINVDGNDAYTIPEDNPFIGDESAMDEIWALGLRNPWRISFDRQTGDLWIADVGQQEIEEINFQPAESTGGENYGWRCYEGSNPYNTEGCLESDLYVFPVHEYAHNPGGFCSVTGGFVYRGEQYPSLEGHYFFADLCRSRIWSLQDSPGNWILSDYGHFQDNTFSTFGEDVNGELFVAALSSGTIYRITADAAFSKNDVEEPMVRVYPNPASDHIIVRFPESWVISVQVTLYAPDGKSIMYEDSDDNPLELDLATFSPGVYVLEIEHGNEMEYRRIIKN